MLWKSDRVKFHPTSLDHICPLSFVYCRCVRLLEGNRFIAWHELLQWWEINCLSKGLCHGRAPWMDLVSWSVFHSPCCAKLLIAAWMEATLKEDSNYSPEVHMLTTQWCLFDLINKGLFPARSSFELSLWYHPTADSILCSQGCLCSGCIY